jgi:DNA processing protein
MGTGLGKVFPDENRGLAKRIATAGALVSQFPPGYGPTKTTFPARNTLIAGLSAVSLVIEMKEHSGTRIELDSALAQSKPVLLWEPILGERHWARDLTEHPLVRFVSTSEEVVEALVSSEHGPRRADRTDRRSG